MLKVAVTGSIGSGKSTVMQMFRKFGALAVNADVVVHDLLANDPAIVKAVEKLLGAKVLTNGRVDRKKIADAVFDNQEVLQALEGILHPAVRREILECYKANKDRGMPLFVAEIPLLFEGDAYKDYDATIAIVADENFCRQRYYEQHPDRDDFDKRVARQMPQEEKRKRATITIENNGSFEDLQQQVQNAYQQLLQREPS